MYKVDSQCRLTIPKGIRKVAKIKPGEVGICLNQKKKFIYISNIKDIQNALCIDIKNIDDRGRFYLNDALLEMIDANRETEFTIGLYNNRICIIPNIRD